MTDHQGVNREVRQIQNVLAAGPGTGAWSAEREAVFDALIDAGKSWAMSTVPDGGRGWREALEAPVRAYLTHPYPDLREAALRTLASYWALPAYRGVAHELARDDPDPDVRATALGAWAEYFRGTNDGPVLNELGRRLGGQGEPDGVRAEAYRGLLIVSGHLDRVPREEVSDLLDVFEDVDGRVDWALVERLLRSASVVM